MRPIILKTGGLLLASVTATACVEDPESSTAPIPFTVSDYFAPSGFMGDGSNADAEAIVLTQDDDTCAPRPEGAKGVCYHFEYTAITGGEGWGGVYWQSPADNWGTIPGRAVDPGADRVVFWAAASRDGIAVTFLAGGLEGTDPDGEPYPYKDPFGVDETFELTTDMKQYTLEIPGDANYTEILGGFGWSMGAAAARDGATLDLDDIRWEG